MKQFVKPFQEEDGSDESAKNCHEEFSIIYIQYFCDFEDHLDSHTNLQLLATFTGIIICFLYVMVIYYIKKTASLNYELWDVNTISPSDFTVIAEIPTSCYAKFIDLQNL